MSLHFLRGGLFCIMCVWGLYFYISRLGFCPTLFGIVSDIYIRSPAVQPEANELAELQALKLQGALSPFVFSVSRNELHC